MGKGLDVCFTMQLIALSPVIESMRDIVPDKISHMVLLEALAFKRFMNDKIENEEEFLELIIDLASLHTQACSQNYIDSGPLPPWLLI